MSASKRRRFSSAVTRWSVWLAWRARAGQGWWSCSQWALSRALEAFGEARGAVAVPFLESVRVEGDPGAATLVGEDRDLVDQVRMLGPAGGDHPVGVPGVFVVEPDDDGLQPCPQFSSELGVAAGGRVPGLGQEAGIADRGLLVVAAFGGEVQVAVGSAEQWSWGRERERQPGRNRRGGHDVGRSPDRPWRCASTRAAVALASGAT